MGSLFSHFPAHRSVPSDVFDTNYGKIRGKKFDISDGAGRFVNAFLGIPYAKPPTGALRFKVGFCSFLSSWVLSLGFNVQGIDNY